jgi:hypothetical protein
VVATQPPGATAGHLDEHVRRVVDVRRAIFATGVRL